MAKARSEAKEVRRIEASLEREAGRRERQARKAWRTLSVQKQLAAARELVEIRADELRLAYKDVVAVTYGYRTKTKDGVRRVTQQPCVTLLVKKKRTISQENTRAFPRQLFMYYPVNRKRTLCAVPTDVECQTIQRVRAQRNKKIVVTFPQTPGVTGVITCIVRRPKTKKQYALSCRHVFGMSAVRPRSFPLGAEAYQSRTESDGTVHPVGNPLADVTDYFGVLVPEKRVSFDATLAEVRNTGTALRTAVKKLIRTTGIQYASGLDEIEEERTYKIWTPSGDKNARWVRPWPGGRKGIRYDGVGTVFMRVVIVESHVTPLTASGDSGSPVVSRDSKKLLGMHIAGGEDGSAFMIPAFDLMSGFNYIGLPKNEKLKVDFDY